MLKIFPYLVCFEANSWGPRDMLDKRSAIFCSKSAQYFNLKAGLLKSFLILQLNFEASGLLQATLKRVELGK